MAALLKLYVDTERNKLVKSATSAQEVTLPTFFQGDVVPIAVTLLEPKSGGGISDPFSIVTDSYTVKIGLTTPHATSGSETVHTNSNLTHDATTNEHEGTLLLNATGVTTLLSGGTSASAQLEIEARTGGGTYSTELMRQVSIKADGLKSSTPVDIATETYPTTAEATATFAAKIGTAGDSITLVSPDGTKGIILYCTNDGEFKSDNITF
jgi:hypothetical protein